MGIIGPDPPGTEVAIGARKVRAAAKRGVDAMKRTAKEFRDLVDQYGRSELAAELADDAPALLWYYNSVQTFLNDDRIPGTCPDLPS